MKIAVGARESPLSKVQVAEIQQELNQYHPEITFTPIFLKTIGDFDQKSSLRNMEKTNFFTKEIDTLLLTKKCDVAIHSAKDLPDPLPRGLQIAAITHGVDPSDALVMRPNETIHTLPKNARIGASSIRREKALYDVRSDFQFVDIRGTIDKRLSYLESGHVDGVVIAEAALVRLQLTHLNRFHIPGTTVPNQGKLAVVIRENDSHFEYLFSPLDTQKVKKTILYLGLDLPKDYQKPNVLHYPIIKTMKRECSIPNLDRITHFLFTSKNGVRHFKEHLPLIKNKIVIAIGKATASLINDFGYPPHHIALEESSEGVVKLLKTISLKDSHFFWPHSSLSRPIIADFFKEKHISLTECILYDTFSNQPRAFPTLKGIEEIIFTSPSTVDAFIEFYGFLPSVNFTSIGQITHHYLNFP